MDRQIQDVIAQTLAPITDPIVSLLDRAQQALSISSNSLDNKEDDDKKSNPLQALLDEGKKKVVTDGIKLIFGG